MSGPFGSQHWMYASGGFYSYSIDQSLRFDAASESELSRTFASGGNRRKWTFSTWIKRTTLTPSGNDDYIFGIRTAANNASFMFLNWRAGDDLIVTGQSTLWLRSDRVFRDVGAWYHIVWSLDTDNSTASQRMRLYVNGSELTSFSTDSRSSLSGDQAVNAAAEHNIGRHPSSTGYGLGAYLAETHFIDGQAYDPSYFGETSNGIWVPKAYSGSYGTTGFYLSYADSSAIGDDLSGNTNDWTANNLAASDVVTDSPTNNFPTLNPLQVSGSITLAEGNLKSTTTNTASTHQAYSTMNIPTSGKWYFECYAVIPRADDLEFGISEIPTPDDRNKNHLTTMLYNASADACAILNNSAGNLTLRAQTGGGVMASSITASTGDIYQIAFDCDTGKVFLGRNNTYYRVAAADGDPSAGTNPTKTLTANKEYCIGLSCYGASGAGGGIINYGQDSTFAGATTAGGNADANDIGDFKYAPPSGFLALCSANLPEATIGPNSATQADDNFNTVLYTGTGSAVSITGVGHQPDWVWQKRRSTAENHAVFDSVRGVQKAIFPNLTNAETTGTTLISSFDSDGFSMAGNNAVGNQSGETYVAWNWKAGGSASSNSNGSITSSVSVNQDAGFSIVSFTGTGANATVGHGLSSAPEMIILKNRIDAVNWLVGSTYNPNGWQNYLNLNGTTSALTASTIWQDTAPTNSVFSIGSNPATNGSGDATIAYCFHSVEGYCKIGSYKGNANTNGTFVSTGFRPAWLMIKNTADVTHWALWDTKRNTFNVSTTALYPSSSGGDSTGTSLYVDFLSSGFKWRSNHNSVNGSNDTFIYLAFAEAPFKYANARQE